jgi:glycosyltransferase involved in cell wall biosynthesis
MKRLLIITTNFPRWEGDPHSPWLVELLGLLRQQGWQVEILAPAYAGQGSHLIDGMQVHRFRYAPARWESLTHEEGAPAKIRRNPLYLLLLPVYLLAGILAAWRLARQTEFDVIHVHWPVPQGIFGLVARWAAGRARGGGHTPRLVATFYGADLVLVQRFKFLRGFLRWFTRCCDDVAAISSYTRKELVALTDVTPRTIPYGIALPPADAEWPTQPGKILFVGRLIPRKGVRYLVEAMAHLEHSSAQLVIVGGGPQQAELEELARSTGIAERVIFAGRVSDEALQDHYRTCQIFVLPSIVDTTGDTEMLGMVLLEAMRYRKPVIASNVGGIPDIVQDGENGLLVPEKDPAALATALKRLLSDRELSSRLGTSGYAYAQNHFGWAAVLNQTLGLYGGSGGLAEERGE